LKERRRKKTIKSEREEGEESGRKGALSRKKERRRKPRKNQPWDSTVFPKGLGEGKGKERLTGSEGKKLPHERKNTGKEIAGKGSKIAAHLNGGNLKKIRTASLNPRGEC